MFQPINAVQAGVCTPQKNETLATVAPAQGPSSKALLTGTEFATATQVPQPVGCKQFASLAARFALKGFELHHLHGDSVMVTRWGLARVLRDLQAAERFLQTVGGANG